MIVKLLFIAIFTFVSTLSPPVLALPSEPESGNGMPPSVGLLPLIKYLQRLGIAGVKLDRTLQTSKFDPDSLQNIGRLSDDIEDLVTQATGEAATLEVLDPIRSSQLTKNALLMKPVFGHLLNVIAMEKDELCEAEYCEEMHDFLTWMRVQCHGLAESLREITQFGDGKLIEICAGAIDKQYANTIVQYEKIIRSGNVKD